MLILTDAIERTIVESEFQSILKLSPYLEENRDMIIDFILDIIEKMHSTINAFENESDPQIKRIADIKKNKSYLDRYIESFELNARYYHLIGDSEHIQLMLQSWETFRAFKEDPELVLNSFAEVSTFMLSIPDIKRSIRLLNEQKKITPKQKKYIYKYNMYKNAQKIAKFFEGYNVTRKGILTSTSIHLFRSLSALKVA